MIKLAIIDDHPMMIQGLKYALSESSDIELTNSYRNGLELFLALENEMMDVILLDTQIPGTTGPEIVPVLLKKYPKLKIIILTNIENALYANNLLTQGVHGYLLKSAELTEIKTAIMTVFRGGTYMQSFLMEKMRKVSYKIKKAVSHAATLSPREKEILHLIADGDTTKEIARKLLLSEGTIDNYRSTILLKLDAKN